MNRILLTLIFAGASLMAFAQPNSSAPHDPTAPKIVFTTMEYNFDSIVTGDTVKYTFTFKNEGKSPLIITDAVVQCGCTKPTFPKEPIPPGKTGTVYVEFRSAGKMGMQDKSIVIKSNNGSGDVVLHLKGNVVAKATTGMGPMNRTGGPQNK